MVETEDTIEAIRALVAEHFDEDDEFVPGESTIRLSRPTFGTSEVMEAIDSLLSTYVTMGEKVTSFEDSWAEYVGSEYAHMVNSGSSANLLALKALEDRIVESGDEVIVPAVAWSTSLFPILDIDAIPVLVDVGIDSYTIDVEAFKEAITPKTSAAVLVHLLGNPCNMGPLVEICEDHDIAIVEDCCEAHGARYRDRHVGTFGELGTYSYFFSHHITTMEGGMVVTNNGTLSERVRMSRAHGWIRELDNPERFTDEYMDIDPRFLFASRGYNLRPTDIQGAFGMHQLPRLEKFVDKRRATAADLTDRLSRFDDYFQFFNESEEARCSWFAYPFYVRDDAPFTRDEFQTYLENHYIETRPILAGNLAQQPVLDQIKYRISGTLHGAEAIHDNGLFIGNHHEMVEEKRKYVSDVVASFVSEFA